MNESGLDHAARLAVVVPVRGKDELLDRSLGSLVAAVRACSDARLILVDNNVELAASDHLRRYGSDSEIVKSTATTVAKVRNDGAGNANGSTFFVFVDCDCVVRPTFCRDVLRVFEESKAEIVGCTVVSPVDGHWLELASDRLHRNSGNGPRLVMNTGCMAVRSDVFAKVRGFDERLTSNEDYDFCERVRAAGGRIWQSEALQTIHLGNPKTISGNFKRLKWHGMGAVRGNGTLVWSPMLYFTLANAAILTIGAASSVLLAVQGMPLVALAVVLISISAAPVAFVCARMLQRRRWAGIVAVSALMQLTFLARATGVLARLKQLRASRA